MDNYSLINFFSESVKPSPLSSWPLATITPFSSIKKPEGMLPIPYSVTILDCQPANSLT